MSHIKNIILLLLLLAIALLTCWMLYKPVDVVSKPSDPKNPETFATNIHEKEIDQTGKLKNILISSRATSYLQDNITKFTDPFCIIYDTQKQSAPWHIKADFGEAINYNKKIFLWQHVKVQQVPGLNSRDFTLLTSRLTLYPQQSLAVTDKPVTIIRPGSVTHAIGLNANFKTGKIKLLSHAQEDYETSGKNKF